MGEQADMIFLKGVKYTAPGDADLSAILHRFLHASALALTSGGTGLTAIIDPIPFKCLICDLTSAFRTNVLGHICCLLVF
jgi:hypothetical protein